MTGWRGMLAVWIGLFLVSPAGAGGPSTQPASQPAERCMYIPPDWADRVVYYNSFERGIDQPEVNSTGGRTTGPRSAGVEGLAGKGCDFPARTDAKRGLVLSGVSFPLHRPLTVMLWWKPTAPMRQTSGFHLISLSGKGYISNFVRGQGDWCGLKEPTFVLQVYNWQNVPNYNGIRHGSGWVEADRWHHAAIVVSKGSNVRVYWDGKLRCDYTIEGRLFRPDDVIKGIELGPHWLFHPMTIDEVMILDKALSPEEIAGYIVAVRELSVMGFPVFAPSVRP